MKLNEPRLQPLNCAGIFCTLKVASDSKLVFRGPTLSGGVVFLSLTIACSHCTADYYGHSIIVDYLIVPSSLLQEASLQIPTILITWRELTANSVC